jgi:hypothetical protein
MLPSLPMVENVALDNGSVPLPFPFGRIGEGDLDPVSLAEDVAVEELVACGPPLVPLELEPLLGPFALFCLTSSHSSSISELLTPTPSSLLLSNVFFLDVVLVPLDTAFLMALMGAGSVGRVMPLFCHVEFFLVSFITAFCDVELDNEVEVEVGVEVEGTVAVRAGLSESLLRFGDNEELFTASVTSFPFFFWS